MDVGGPDILSVEIESHDRLLVSVVKNKKASVLIIIFVARFGSHSFDVVFAEFRTDIR